MPTPAEIDAMEGPALTRLAYALGLAPLGVQPTTDVYGRVGGFIGNPWVQPGFDYWEPHTHLAQAQAVFRRLRTDGWSLQTHHYPALGYGEIRARKIPPTIVIRYDGETPAAEAMALLRCAVLAKCAQAEGTRCPC